jgi:hypothetical protein
LTSGKTAVFPTSVPQPPVRNGCSLFAHPRFRLFPFRSPLLRESISLSLPPGTKMFQFPGCPSSEACRKMTRHDPRRVSPFGDLRIIACLQLPEAYRRLPRPSSALCAKASTVCPYLFPSFASLIPNIPSTPLSLGTYSLAGILP